MDQEPWPRNYLSILQRAIIFINRREDDPFKKKRTVALDLYWVSLSLISIQRTSQRHFQLPCCFSVSYATKSIAVGICMGSKIPYIKTVLNLNHRAIWPFTKVRERDRQTLVPITFGAHFVHNLIFCPEVRIPETECKDVLGGK